MEYTFARVLSFFACIVVTVTLLSSISTSNWVREEYKDTGGQIWYFQHGLWKGCGRKCWELTSFYSSEHKLDAPKVCVSFALIFSFLSIGINIGGVLKTEKWYYSKYVQAICVGLVTILTLATMITYPLLKEIVVVKGRFPRYHSDHTWSYKWGYFIEILALIFCILNLAVIFYETRLPPKEPPMRKLEEPNFA